MRPALPPPNFFEQLSRRPLTSTTGVRGFRLAFVGGAYFEPLTDLAGETVHFADPRDARRAQLAAEAAVVRLHDICQGERA